MEVRREASFEFLLHLLLSVVLIASLQERSTETSSDSFGARQVEQIMEDRPDMRGVLPRGSNFIAWVEAALNDTEGIGRVHWDRREPPVSSACHYAPYGPFPAHVRVSRDRVSSPVDKWFLLVFELHNLARNKKIAELIELAVCGEIDAEAFAHACVKSEFAALEDTQAFLKSNPIASPREGEHPLYADCLNMVASFDDYLASIEMRRSSDYDPLAHFREYFETLQPSKPEK